MNDTICVYFNYTKSSMYMDKFGCSLMTFTATLYYYDFGYICMAPLALIAVISIFGKFKGNYRWFILNQVIWDIIVSYDYSCDNYLKEEVKPGLSCFYSSRTYANPSLLVGHLSVFANNMILNAPFSALFLLSASRFLALYFPFFYDRITHGSKIFWISVIFNLSILIFDTETVFTFFRNERAAEIDVECNETLQKNLSMCVNKKYDPVHNFWNTLGLVFLILQYFKPCMFLVLSTFAALAIFWKVAKQAKFQSKHNRKDFTTSRRIAIVIGLQIVMNCFVFLLDVFGNLVPQMIHLLSLKIITGKTYVRGFERMYTLLKYWDLRLPDWLDGYYGFTAHAPHQMVKQFRILIESVIICLS